MSTPKTVFLHIGHGKTGTSAFQSYLATAQSEIEKHGFYYHCHPNLDAARHLNATSGNLTVRSDIEKKTWFKSQVLDVVQSNESYHTYIFSNEFVFHHMDPVFEDFECMSSNRIGLKILLAVRNPLDMIESEYQQLVKVHGYSKSIDDFLISRRFQCLHTLKAQKLVLRMEEVGIDYTLLNYSTLGTMITPALAHALNISELFSAEVFQEKQVNRSLTLEELQLVIFINQFFGDKLGAKVSRKLIAANPMASRQQIAYEDASIRKVIEIMTPHVESLNKRLRPSDHLKLDYDNESATRITASLTEEQVAICRSFLKQPIQS